MSPASSVAIIIPTLNEAGPLDALLGDLARQHNARFDAIVVDGGSDDATCAVARRRGATLVHAPTGRGAQMNAGRAAASQDWLLFLHADTRVEDRDLLRDALGAIEPDQCGHFRLRFRTDDPRFRFLEAKSALNRPHTTSGDQGLLVSAALFDEIGGFDDSLPFLEDQRFAETARRAGVHWVTLPGELSTSARGFASHGFGARYFSMAVIMAAWAGGADELFELAPDLYQYELPDLLRAARDATARMGSRRAIQVYLRAAAFARRNVWQLFFAVDVALADGPVADHPVLDWHDRLFEDGVSTRLFDAAIAAVGFLLVDALLSAARPG